MVTTTFLCKSTFLAFFLSLASPSDTGALRTGAEPQGAATLQCQEPHRERAELYSPSLTTAGAANNIQDLHPVRSNGKRAMTPNVNRLGPDDDDWPDVWAFLEQIFGRATMHIVGAVTHLAAWTVPGHALLASQAGSGEGLHPSSLARPGEQDDDGESEDATAGARHR